MLQYFSEGKAVEAPRYTGEDFLFRWKKLERIVEREALDGLVIVTGLDGGQHPNTSYLFNWLFLGLSGQQVLANRYLDPRYSQMIVVLGMKESFIFLPPQSRRELEGLVYSLQNCTIFAPTESQFNNRDQFQLLKIAAFARAVNRATKLGFFLDAAQEVKTIEKWPIIQSYALEPVGRTFFTLKFQTTNINPKITPLFRNFDKHSLRELHDRNAYALQGQLHGSTQLIQYTPPQNRTAISETQLQQPLFEAADIVGQGITQRPVKVLFGARTGQPQATSSSKNTIAESKAYHMTIEHFDPSTQLQVWRTYFLQSNLKNNWEVRMVDQENNESFIVTKQHVITRTPNPLYQSRAFLINAYLGLVQSVLDGISTVSRDYRNLTRQFLQTHIAAKLNAAGIPAGKEQVEVLLQSFDSFGQPRAIDFKDSITFKLTSTFYVLKCRLNGLVSPTTQEPLGSLAFSESFLLQEGCYLLLTKGTPYFDFWRTAQPNDSIIKHPNPNIPFPELGRCVSGEFSGRLFIPLEKLSSSHINLPILTVKYFLHEGGLRLHHDKLGWQVLPFSAVSSAAVAGSTSKDRGMWTLFQTQSPLLFDGLQSNCLALEFRLRAFEELMKRVEEKALTVAMLETMPGVLADDWYFQQQVMGRQVREGALLHQHQILQRDFLWAFIEAKQLMVLNQMKDIKLASFRTLYQQRLDRKTEPLPPSSKTNIVVINGTYASQKLKLAQTLARFGPTEYKYHIFNVPSENLFAKLQTNTFLEMLKEAVQEAGTDHIFLVVVPSWVNSAELLPLLSEHYHIRSVICKVNAGNFFSSVHGELTENVLTFAVAGWAQTVVVDCQGEEEEALVGSVTRILRGFARESRITRASNSVLSTGQCVDLLKEDSFNSEYQKFLRGKYGALYRFDQLSQLSLAFLEFRLPLTDLALLQGLQQAQGYLVDRAALDQELRPQRIQAENSKDELMEGLFKLQEVMTLQRKREKATQIRSLKGVVLLEGGERAELLWANGVFKKRVIPTGTQTLGLCVLARNYDQLQLKEFLLSLTVRRSILQRLQPLLTLADISEEQRTAISRAGKDRYLSQGEFYDGYFYRDAEGHILPQHPQLERLLQQWLSERNAEVQASNLQIRQEWQAYQSTFQ